MEWESERQTFTLPWGLVGHVCSLPSSAEAPRGSAAAFVALLDLRVAPGHFSLASRPCPQPPPRLGESTCSVLCGSP